jgi:uncharacterized protein
MDKIILAIILAGFGAQVVKLVGLWFKHKTLSWSDLVVTGGMPSSHAAFVVSLVTIIYFVEGVSTSFAVSLVLAMIVIRDAFGVRRTAGEEGLVINKIVKKLRIKTNSHFAMGHTPLQVLVGSVLGFLVSLGVYYLL